ncbi:MAG: glycosyltransferase [Bryobacteraceae bacterium]
MGSFTSLQLKRSLASFPLDHDLLCDPLLSRYKNHVTAHIRAFEPDLVHITSPGDFGILGLWVAHTLGVPLVASWHTNFHEYAARRLNKLFSFLPVRWRSPLCDAAEEQSLRAGLRFYGLARFLLAPNQSMVDLLRERTGKPARLMAHGVDTTLFSPRQQEKRSAPFVIGYVGRLTPEKNVRLFAGLERSLLAAGQRDFRFVLVGDGNEKTWLKSNLRFGETPGVLRGAALAEAFAAMDVFVFPSQTDTFGLVLLEAMASGVPVVVSPSTAIRVGVRHGITGFQAEGLAGYTQSVQHLMNNPGLQRTMGSAARKFACSRGWDEVFDDLYRLYRAGLAEAGLSVTDHAAAEGAPAGVLRGAS